MTFFTEQNIFIFLIQIFLLLGLARGLGELFRKWKQPTVTAEILVGILLGPTIFGRFLPALHQRIFPPDITQQCILETVSWLGLLFLLLESGLKMDFSIAWRQRGKALTIALTDIVVPMSISFIVCLFIPSNYLVNPAQRILFCFFMATAMTISAMPNAIRALNDLNLAKTDLGYLTISALSVNEVIGWMIFSIILSIFIKTSITIASLLTIFIVTISFIVFCLSYGRKFADFVISRIKTLNLPEPGSSLTFICLLGFFCGAVMQKAGLSALLGFFIAGVMAGEAKALPERTRQVISQMVYAIFIPLFFAGIGLKLDFLKNFNLFLACLIAFFSISGKFLGAWLGASFAKLSKPNRLPVAVAHTPGGSMEIVIGVLALKYNLITESIFVSIVFSAVVSAVLLGPWLAHTIARRKEISILEFFSRANVITEIKATDRNGVLLELCSNIAEQENILSADALYDRVLRREEGMETAIEEGIALPHTRLPSLMKSIIAFGRTSAGIEWNSPDGKPTHFVFLVLTPQENDWAQIQILGIIARVMAKKEMRELIIKAETPEVLWNVLEKAFSSHRIIKKSNSR